MDRDFRVGRPKRKDDAFIDRMWCSSEASASRNRLLASASTQRAACNVTCAGPFFALYTEGDSPQTIQHLITENVRDKLSDLREKSKTAKGKDRASISSLIRNLKPYEKGPPEPKASKSKAKKRGAKIHTRSATYDKIAREVEQRAGFWRQYLHYLEDANPRLDRLESLPIELKLVYIQRWMECESTVETCVVGRRWLQKARAIQSAQSASVTDDDGATRIDDDAIVLLEKALSTLERRHNLDTDHGILDNFNTTPVAFIDPTSPLTLPPTVTANVGASESFGFLNSFQIEFIDVLASQYTDFTRSEGRSESRFKSRHSAAAITDVIDSLRPQIWVIGNVGVGKSTVIPISALKLAEIDSDARVIVVCPKWWAVFDMVGICLTLGIPVSIIDKTLKEQLSWQTCGKRPHQKVPKVTVGIPEFIYPYLQSKMSHHGTANFDLSKWVLAIDEVTQAPSQTTLDLLALPFRASVLSSANLPVDRSTGEPIKMHMPNWDAAMVKCGINDTPIIVDSANTPVGMRVVCEGGDYLDPLECVGGGNPEGVEGVLPLPKFVHRLETYPSIRRFFTVNDLSRVMSASAVGGTADSQDDTVLLQSYRQSSYFDQGSIFGMFQKVVPTISPGATIPPPRSDVVTAFTDLSSVEGLEAGLKNGSVDRVGQMLFYTPDPKKALETIILNIVDLGEWADGQARYLRDANELEVAKEKELRMIKSASGKQAREIDGESLSHSHLGEEQAEISSRKITSFKAYLPKSIIRLLPAVVDVDMHVQEVFDDDTLTPIEAIGIVLGLGAYVHSTKGSSYTSHVQARASAGNFRVVLSSLDPHKGAVFALNAQFRGCAFDESYFMATAEDDESTPDTTAAGGTTTRSVTLLVPWGVMYQALGRVGRRGQSYHAVCFLGKDGSTYLKRLICGEEDASFTPERDALERVALERMRPRSTPV